MAQGQKSVTRKRLEALVAVGGFFFAYVIYHLAIGDPFAVTSPSSVKGVLSRLAFLSTLLLSGYVPMRIVGRFWYDEVIPNVDGVFRFFWWTLSALLMLMIALCIYAALVDGDLVFVPYAIFVGTFLLAIFPFPLKVNTLVWRFCLLAAVALSILIFIFSKRTEVLLPAIGFIALIFLPGTPDRTLHAG